VPPPLSPLYALAHLFTWERLEKAPCLRPMSEPRLLCVNWALDRVATVTGPTKIQYALIFSPMHARCPTQIILLHLINLIISVESTNYKVSH
jgi:hypothetical protein